MVSGNNFEADLAGIKALADLAEEIADGMRGTLKAYQDEMEGIWNWFGFTDSYARETGPGFRRAQEQFTEALLAAAAAFNAIKAALGEAQYEVTDAQGWANGEIAQGLDATENFDFGAGGRR
ncbi:hypothetical protein [Streptomyces sp. NPDC046862]|uniref:hypothetical protein n=1 Tax=Streptomyces sp. NPDC046862 TaxID=3154603 RepID=UPI003452AA4F